MKSLKFLKSYIYNNSRSFIFYCLFTVVVIVVTTSIPLVNARFIDSLVSVSRNSFIKALILLGVLWMLEIIFSYWKSFSMFIFSVKVSFGINLDVINHVKKIPLAKISEYEPSYLTQRIHTDSSIITTFFANHCINAIIQIVYFIVSFFMIITTDLFVSLFLVAIIPLYVLVFLRLKNQMYAKNATFVESQNIFYSNMNGQVTNVKLIKLNSWYDRLRKDLQEKFNIMFEEGIGYTKLSYLFSNIDRIIKYLATIIISLYSGYRVLEGSLTLGQFTMISTYFSFIMAAVSSTFSFFKISQEANFSVQRLYDLIDIPEEHNGVRMIERINNISLNNVSYSYDPNKEGNVIQNLSFEFVKGKIYAIIGGNGTGKTTLVNILLGILQNHTGVVKINNFEIEKVDMLSLRRDRIAIVDQEAIMFFDTIKENLLADQENNCDFSNEKNTELLIRKFGKLNLLDFIWPLTNGLHTKLNDKALSLSGGQKQRIVLSRALQKDSDLLIMDEPSSALDSNSKNIVINHLIECKTDKIVILITHDEELISIADEIIKIS